MTGRCILGWYRVFFLDWFLGLVEEIPTHRPISSLFKQIVKALFWLLRLSLNLLRLTTSRLLVSGLLLSAGGRLDRALVLGTDSGAI